MTVESASFQEHRAIRTSERPCIDQLIQFKGLRLYLRNHGISELIMQKLPLLVLFIVFTVGLCFSQSLSDPLLQGTSAQGTSVDCSDPTMAGSAQCSNAQAQRSNGTQGGDNSSSSTRTPV